MEGNTWDKTLACVYCLVQ